MSLWTPTSEFRAGLGGEASESLADAGDSDDFATLKTSGAQ